jgi:hypothetical protein
MLSGDKHLTIDAPPSVDNMRSRLFAAVLVAICAGAVAWLVSLGD